jgi:succinate dehydrogenase iron-sulfur subunit
MTTPSAGGFGASLQLGTNITLSVFRYNPKIDTKPRYQLLDVPLTRGMTVLEALLYAKEHYDNTIAIRYSCRMASCGSCGMKINGHPKLACDTQISELHTPEVTIEPMDNYPILRDLVPDFNDFFVHHKQLNPWLIRNDLAEQDNPAGTYLQTQEEVDKYLQFSNCIKCGLCYSACPTVATDKYFPGPQSLAQAYRYVVDSRDEGSNARVKLVDTHHGIWRCHFAGSCSAVCPKGVDPAMGIQLLRKFLLTGQIDRKKAGTLLFKEVAATPN